MPETMKDAVSVVASYYIPVDMFAFNSAEVVTLQRHLSPMVHVRTLRFYLYSARIVCWLVFFMMNY